MSPESEVMKMMTFSIVRRIGEGSYLDEDLFIIERVRRERMLKALHSMRNKIGSRSRITGKNGKANQS